ncbi:MAG: error-prone DNA polymerase DnaE2 [Herpetosiphon sp.]
MTYSLATVRTYYDLLNSLVAPEPLIEAAQRHQLIALGVIDRTTLSHVRLALAVRDTGIHLVFGATITMADGFPLRILARNSDGYRSLCRLVSAQAQGQLRLPYEMLRTEQKGLYILCGGRRGRLWQAVLHNEDRALWTLARLQSYAEHDDRFIVECQQLPGDREADIAALQRLIKLAARVGVRCIASHDVSMPRNEDAARHRLVHAMERRSSFWSADPALPGWQQDWKTVYTLPDPQAWHRHWEGLEHLVAGSTAVLRDCQVEILGARRFPGATLPTQQVYDTLWTRAFLGLRQRYNHLTPLLMKRLHHEINQVTEQGVGPFLIHAADLVERAVERGLRLVLQGSGTGSLICYALGISTVDPMTIGEGLVFERFAGTHRGAGDVPDLDFGIPAGRESEVKQILIEMFGAQRVAHLTAVVTIGDRGALRQAAEAFGWDDHAVTVLNRKLRRNEVLDREEQMIVNAAEGIVNQPHHLARHSSGLVIADEPLSDIWSTGCTPDGMASMVLADKDDCEALQVLKFDFLNWYGLRMFEQAAATIQAEVYPRPELWQVPSVDDRTAAILQQADTLCIPFLQSPACRSLLWALKTTSEPDLALCLGALRPGASTTRGRLLAAIHGGTEALPHWNVFAPDHRQIIDTILAPSKGAMIFDEDMLRLAHAVGLPLADCERLRKAIKRRPQATDPLVNRFRAIGLANGWSDREIDALLEWFRFLERYTFLRGHAVALGHVAWRLARLQVHYPAHFYAAALDQLGKDGGGMYPNLVYATEARHKGLILTAPSVNGPWQSQPNGNTIHCGLTLLKPVIGEETLRHIHTEAQIRAFNSVGDLQRRVTLRERELEHLIAAGALDTLTPSRRHARWETRTSVPKATDQSQLLFDSISCPLDDLEIESCHERIAEEYAVLGFPITASHPLVLYEAELARYPIITAEQLARQVDRKVQIAGVVVAHRTIRTVHNTKMGFLSVCDATGVAELMLGEAVLQRTTDAIHTGTVLHVTGRVSSDRERGISLEVHALHFLEPTSTLGP